MVMSMGCSPEPTANFEVKIPQCFLVSNLQKVRSTCFCFSNLSRQAQSSQIFKLQACECMHYEHLGMLVQFQSFEKLGVVGATRSCVWYEFFNSTWSASFGRRPPFCLTSSSKNFSFLQVAGKIVLWKDYAT